jgi:hypothetical protein
MDEGVVRTTVRAARRSPFVTVLILAGVLIVVAGGLFVLIDRPWRDSAVAAASPDPCLSLDTDAARRLIPTAKVPQSDGHGAADRVRECRLNAPAGMLAVEFDRTMTGDLRSGAARTFTAKAHEYGALQPIPDLGDAAAVGSPPGTQTIAVLVRRRNVVVTVLYFPGGGAPSLPDGGRPDCVAVARMAASAVNAG